MNDPETTDIKADLHRQFAKWFTRETDPTVELLKELFYRCPPFYVAMIQAELARLERVRKGTS